MGNSIVCYTAFTAGKDELIMPLKTEGVDFRAYVEYDGDHTVWDMCRLINPDPRPVMRAKRYKIMPHEHFPHYEESVWIDGNYEVIGDLRKLVKVALKDTNIAFFKHPEGRDCLYQEVDACLRLKKGDPEKVKQQGEEYRQLGHPEHWGLVACPVIVRRHNAFDCSFAMNKWMDEIEKYSWRDQISIMRVLKQWDIPFTVIPGDVRENKWVRKKREHLDESKIIIP